MRHPIHDIILENISEDVESKLKKRSSLDSLSSI